MTLKKMKAKIKKKRRHDDDDIDHQKCTYLAKEILFESDVIIKSRKEKKIKLIIIILAEKQLLYEINQILKNSELFVITNEKIFNMTQRFSFICRIKAREYSAYKKRDQTYFLYDKLIYQLHRKKKNAQ